MENTQNTVPKWQAIRESKVGDFVSPATLKYLTQFAEDNPTKSVEGWFDHVTFLGTKAAERSIEYAKQSKAAKDAQQSLVAFQTEIARNPAIAGDAVQLLACLAKHGLTPADLGVKGHKA